MYRYILFSLLCVSVCICSPLFDFSGSSLLASSAHNTATVFIGAFQIEGFSPDLFFINMKGRFGVSGSGYSSDFHVYAVDIDTSGNIPGGNQVYYRSLSPGHLGLTQFQGKIRQHVDPLFTATRGVVVTWQSVGQSPAGTLPNTFQGILATNGQKAYIGYVYETFSWLTSSASFDVDRISGSVTSKSSFVLLANGAESSTLWTSSNVGEPGLWIGSFECQSESGFPTTTAGKTSTVNNCLANQFGNSTRDCLSQNGIAVWDNVNNNCHPCPSGYSSPQNSPSCFDIDECSSANFINGGCSLNAKCTNTLGSRACQCNSGYEGDGLTCTDIDECTSANFINGGCSINAKCTNEIGSRTCQCFSGYTGDGFTCIPSQRINETESFRPSYRFFLDGNTEDSSGNNGVINITNYSFVNFYQRGNPTNQAIRINDGPGVFVTNVSNDGTFSVHMIINFVSNANVIDLFRVINSNNQVLMTIRLSTIGKLIYINSNGAIIGTTRSVIRTGISYFMIFSYHQSTISTFIDRAELGKFPVTIPNGVYSFHVGKGMNGFLDEINIYDTATFSSNYLIASQATRCLRSCPTGTVCYNTATSNEICANPI